MKRNALLVCGFSFLLLQTSLRASAVIDGMTWYTSGNAASLTTITDTTVDPSSSVLSFNAASGALAVTSLPGTLVPTASAPITLSLSFRDLDQTGLRIGLFNDGGTPGTADGTSVTQVGSQTNNDIGSFLILNKTNCQTVMETASASLFYGTRTSGTALNYSSTSLGYSSLGTGDHTLTMIISLSGTTYTMSYLLDGVNVGSSTTTDAALASINEIGFAFDGTPSSLEIGKVSVAVPEPSVPALMGVAGAGLAFLALRRRLNVAPVLPHG